MFPVGTHYTLEKCVQVGLCLSTAVAVDREKHIRSAFPTERMDSDRRVSLLGLLSTVFVHELGAFPRSFVKVSALLEPIQLRQADHRR